MKDSIRLFHLPHSVVLILALHASLTSLIATPSLSVVSVRGFPGHITEVPLVLRFASNDVRNVVALQADLIIESGQANGLIPLPGGALRNHTLTSSEPDVGVHRIVAYSQGNSTLSNGVVALLPLSVPAGSFQNVRLSVRNVILATAQAQPQPSRTSPGGIAINPVFLIPGGGVDGFLLINTNGVDDPCYVVQGTTNLLTWVNLSTNTTSGDLLQFSEDDVTMFPYRYYRAIPCGAVQGCLQAPPGLVAWWPGDGDARDVIGTNHGVLLNGAGFAAGVVGNGFRFDGIDDYISVAPAPALHFSGTSPFSFSFWIAPEYTGSPADIITRLNAGITGDLEIYSDEYNQVSFWALAQAEPQLLVSTPIVPYGSFTHVVMTFDGSTKEIYLNGALNKSLASAPLLLNANGETDLLIGVRRILDQPYFPNAYKGIIDELQIFNRALSAGEVDGIHRAGSAGLCRP